MKRHSLVYFGHMKEEVLGYFLLVTGLVIIVISAVTTYMIFTGTMDPIVKLSIDHTAPSALGGIQATQGLSVDQIRSVAQQLITPFSGSMDSIINLTVQILLAGFFVNIGYKIALIGVTLIRPVVVKTKDTPGTPQGPVA